MRLILKIHKGVFYSSSKRDPIPFALRNFTMSVMNGLFSSAPKLIFEGGILTVISVFYNFI